MLLVMAGCTEQDDFKTREQAVVFGQRNVETTRGLFELVRDSSFERELAYKLAALSRANTASDWIQKANFPMAHDAFGRLYGVEPICVVKVVP